MASNVTPVTRSPLSAESRQSFSGVSGAASTPIQPIAPPQPTVMDVQTLQLTQQNQQNLLGLQTGLNEIRQNIAVLNSGLQNISVLLQNDISNDQRILLAEQERERRLSEQGVRAGDEKVVESKINRAFILASAPVARRTTNLFDRIAQSLLYLFSGWLMNKYGELIEARGKGNVDLVQQIKNSILTGVRNATNVLLLLNGGIQNIVRSIGSLSKFVLDLLIRKPFQGLKSLFQGASAAKNLPGKPPKTPGAPGFIGSVLTALGVGLEAMEGNYTEAILGAVSLTPMGRIARLAGLIYNAEQLLDLIGKGVIDEKDKSEGEKEPKEPSKPANGDSSPEIQGQGSDNETGVEPNTSNGNIPDASESENSGGNTTPSPSTSGTPLDDITNTFNEWWRRTQENLGISDPQSSAQPQTPVVPTSTTSSSSPATPVVPTSTTSSSSPATPPVTGRDALMDTKRNSRSNNYNSTNIAQNTNTEAQDPIIPVHMGDTATEDLEVGQTNNELERLAKEERNINADPIISANPESKKTTQQPVQKLPDPKPTIITNNSQTSSPSPINVDSDKSMTKIPMIASSNPENFYTLYSLHAYNVVV
jgi:hypothetical protein